MANPDNEPQIPKNQSPITDDRTGLVSRDWYRFFLNLLNKANQGGGGGTGTVTSVNVSGGSTGLTTSGGPVTTSGTITLAGTLDVDNGGTGATTAAGAQINLNVPSTSGTGATGTWPISVSGNAANVTGTVAVVNGGTGATDAAGARTNLGAAASGANSDITSMTGITGGISTPDYIAFDTNYTTTLTEGQLGWDGNNTLGLGMAGGNVIQHIGEDQFFYCKATSAVTKGQVVMFTGAVGASGVPTGAPATGITDGTYIMGIAAEAIATNAFGLVQSFGTLRNVNTSGYADGDILWYDPSVAGGLTKTKPSAPNVKVQMAAVINGGSSGGGTILIRIDPGSVLGGTDSNVGFGTLANNDLIQYDSTAGYWKNVAPSSVTGIGSLANALTIGTGLSGTSYNGSSAVTITNTGVLSLTGTASQVTVSASTGSITISLPATINVDTSGNAATVTNGVYTTGSYADPTWITSLAGSKITGNISGNAANVTGTVAIANGGTGQTTKVAAFDALSPTTTKGDLIVSDGTDNVRLPVGADNYVLTADSTQTSGVKWALASGSGATISNDTTTATNVYPTFAAATSGALANIYTSNAKLLYKPSTGELTSTAVVASNGIFVNSLTVSANYTIASGYSGMSAGVVSVANGITVTVSNGSRWVVV